MLAVAARIGAPLGHDFCAISLSDNLKPWEVIEARLEAVARAGFVIALYNPISRARPWQLGKAFENLRRFLPDTTPVIFGRAAGRPDERMAVMNLAEADASRADMATCVIIGSPETRIIDRGERSPLVYTPRFLLLRRRADDRPSPRPPPPFRPSGISGTSGRRNRITSMPSSRAAAILP